MKIYNDFPLSQILYYKIGGDVKYLLEVENKEDILEAFNFIKKNNIGKFMVVGFGANLLMNDKKFDGAVIHMKNSNNRSLKLLEENKIEAFGGEKLDDVINFAFEYNLIGLEWAGGLPSTVGAAIRGNVGAFGKQIEDVFEKAEVVKVLDNGLNNISLDKKNMKFSYRESIIKKDGNLIIVSVIFKLKKVNDEKLEEAKKVYFSNKEYRKTYHPINIPNCGSVFKNIENKDHVEKILDAWPDIREKVETNWYGKVSMGYIINRLGFNGFQKGNAKVSDKHCNFIVNLGGASFSDVYSIITGIKNKFNETFGFLPETEIEIVE